MTFHSPTSINYHNGTHYTDLRTTSLPSNIEIIVNASTDAIASDIDESNGPGDYYANDLITGSYPLLATDTGPSSSNSMLVLSGERVYSSLFRMYSDVWNYQDWYSQQGKQVVDNIISYYFVETLNDYHHTDPTPTSEPTSTTSETTSTKTSTTIPSSNRNEDDSPIVLPGIFVSMFLIIAIYKSKHK